VQCVVVMVWSVVWSSRQRETFGNRWCDFFVRARSYKVSTSVRVHVSAAREREREFRESGIRVRSGAITVRESRSAHTDVSVKGGANDTSAVIDSNHIVPPKHRHPKKMHSDSQNLPNRLIPIKPFQSTSNTNSSPTILH
jgi:hypothetical protein